MRERGVRVNQVVVDDFIGQQATPSEPPRVTLIRTGLVERPETKIVPPLGCMYLAAVLRERLGAECRIYDPRVSRVSFPELVSEVALARPLVIGISVMTTESDQMHELARLFKQRLPSTPIVVGGPHAASDLEDILLDRNIDWAVKNEGEETFFELVDALWRGQEPREIAGAARRQGDTIVEAPARQFIEDLDTIPFPAWDLIEPEAYFSKNRPTIFYKNKNYMPVFSSRACPFKCSYCHHVFGKRFRGRSSRNVLEEMRLLYHEYGIREFEFYDDCFNFDKKRCKAILGEFSRSEMKDATLQFPNGFRADILDDEIIDLLGEARVFSISIGIESGSDRVQKVIGKNVNLRKLEAAVAKVSKRGVLLHGFFMFGFPTETRDEMEQTIDLANRLEIDTASFFIVNPFKGTQLDSHVEDHDEAREFDYFRARDNLSQVTDEELTRVLRRAYATFYLTPRRIKRVARALASCPHVVVPGLRILYDRLFFIGAGSPG